MLSFFLIAVYFRTNILHFNSVCMPFNKHFSLVYVAARDTFFIINLVTICHRRFGFCAFLAYIYSFSCNCQVCNFLFLVQISFSSLQITSINTVPTRACWSLFHNLFVCIWVWDLKFVLLEGVAVMISRQRWQLRFNKRRQSQISFRICF